MMGGSNHWKLYVNGLDIGLESDQVCNRVLSSIALLVVCALEVGVDYSYQ